MLTDLMLVTISPFLGLLLRVNYDEAFRFLPDLLRLLPYILICRAIAFAYFDTHRIIWRYVSAVDAIRLAKAVLASTFAIIAIAFLFKVGYVPRSLYFIDAILILLMMSSARIARRMLHEYQGAKEMRHHGQKTLIYGAGATGQGILKRILGDRDLNLLMVGFVDDDEKKIGRIISGYRVFAGQQTLSRLIRELEIKQIVIGIPNPSREFLRFIVKVCSEYSIRPLLMTTTAGQGEVFREVELKDLLVREPHKINLDSTRKMIFGKRVLITGGGGSIGSEICRQILSYEPSSMVVLDHSEFNLYNIDSELNHFTNYSVVKSKLVDIKDAISLEAVFSEYRPEIVLHAAAYKHVHLVESNPYTSILNNVLGTKNLLDISEKYEVENFVQVSTDKAVNPVGIMGATKRICELMTSMKGFKTKRQYCSVRFGNVLGSSGSLIPKLKKQIESGEALTITHQDMTRYFMLIEEAVSLVLKAASIASAGDVNVLRMGEPVKIVDIAKTLIQLMGKSEEDVEIKFTGLRPGEKMFEELYISGKELNTEHPDILVVPRGDNILEGFSATDFDQQIQQLIETAKAFDHESVVILSKLVASKYELKQASQAPVIQLHKS